jgi:NAD(P)-dependent dehydrogenase (short-subunit alcohol dehydrogenase family)
MSAFKDNLLAGKTAFVAGGTSGINLGIAKRFAALGAKVAVAGRNPAKALGAAAEIGPDALGLSADVRDYAAIRAAMEQVVQAHGKLDIVVSGAAGNFLAPALGMSANAFKTVVDIDLLGTFNVFRGCHDLLNTPGASLIAITAGQAVNAVPLQVHACAAKAGVNQVVRVLAMEWGPDVRVNAISPGPIETPLIQAIRPPPGSPQAAIVWGETEDVAAAVVYLASDEAKFVNGAILTVDGGQTAVGQ